MSKSREDIIREGIAHNRYRKLSRIWDQWQPFRAHRFDGSWQQEKANEICSRIGPEIVALRQQLDASKAR